MAKKVGNPLFVKYNGGRETARQHFFDSCRTEPSPDARPMEDFIPLDQRERWKQRAKELIEAQEEDGCNC